MQATLTIREDELRDIITAHIIANLGALASKWHIEIETELYSVRVALKDYSERMAEQREAAAKLARALGVDETPEADLTPSDYIPAMPPATVNDPDPF